MATRNLEARLENLSINDEYDENGPSDGNKYFKTKVYYVRELFFTEVVSLKNR